jgi:hypothetical protein
MTTDQIIKLALFDFKYAEQYCDFQSSNRQTINQSINRQTINKLLDVVEKHKSNDAVKRFINYRYTEGGADLDDSNGKCPYTRAIYNILWGRNEKNDEKIVFDRNGYSNFRTLKLFDKNILFGGDTANSVQTLINNELNTNTKEIKETIAEPDGRIRVKYELQNSKVFPLLSDYHRIGNFVLVPAYFNGWRGCDKNIEDYFDKSLLYLQKKGFDSLSRLISQNRRYKDKEKLKHKVDNLYDNFAPDDFTRYINTMFLWDYVTPDEGNKNYRVKSLRKGDWRKGNFPPCCEDDHLTVKLTKEEFAATINNIRAAISRRSLFAALMLNIALDCPHTEKAPDRNWEASDFYQILMKDLFMINHIYSGWSEIFDKIITMAEENEIDTSDIILVRNEMNKTN